MEAILINADVFVDGSGASALVGVGAHRFGCSFAAGRAVVHYVNSLRSPRPFPKRAFRAAEVLFQREVVEHLTPAYLAKHAALYDLGATNV